MKIRLINILLLFIISFSSALFAQLPSADGMKELAFLIGEWEGNGWHDHGEKGVRKFVQTISTNSFMNGEILVSEQRAVDANDAQNVILQAVVIYSFDAGANMITARSMLSRGRDRIVGIRVDKDGISWPNRKDGGRFHTHLSKDGNLVTRASLFGPDSQYFEMTLQPSSVLEDNKLAQQKRVSGTGDLLPQD